MHNETKIEAQEKLINYCERLTSIIKPANLTTTFADKLAALSKDVRERELIVPIVGNFSSGKSSLINSLLGTQTLPVAIKPETSLSMELHYAIEDRIEAVKIDGSVVTYRVDEIEALSADAANYLYASLYLNNEALQRIEPLVLVDMPGFDSPVADHNKAILAYLGRGCHYLVLSSVEEGTISNSLMRRLREIDEYGRGFNVFLSKSDLKPKDALDKLLQHYTQVIHDNFDADAHVVSIDKNSASDVLPVLNSLNPNVIFFNIFRESLTDLCSDVIDELNIKLKASRKNVEQITDAIREMTDGIAKLEKNRQMKWKTCVAVIPAA
jgi:GTP-binding protein EngB required for normal cell division